MAKSNDSKIYESYEMLATLLNSNKKENIDKAYDALASITKSNYESAMKSTADSYYNSRNTLSANKAKADKYMNYFLTEGGYEGGGIAADAKIKSELTYQNNTALLDRAQKAEENEHAKTRDEALMQLEIDRANEKNAADSELADSLYKAQVDERDYELKEKELANENYWKQKEYDLKAQSYSGDSSGKEAYEVLMYNKWLDKMADASTLEQKQAVYDSASGANTQKVVSELGESRYSSLMKNFQADIAKKRKEEKYNDGVFEIYQMLSEEGKEADEVYTKLYKQIKLSKHPIYTPEQLDDAVSLYRESLNYIDDYDEYAD